MNNKEPVIDKVVTNSASAYKEIESFLNGGFFIE